MNEQSLPWNQFKKNGLWHKVTTNRGIFVDVACGKTFRSLSGLVRYETPFEKVCQHCLIQVQADEYADQKMAEVKEE